MITSRAWVITTLIGLVSAILYPCLTLMPPPYDDGGAQAIDDERRALFPGGANGPAFPADLSGKLWVQGLVDAKLRSAELLFIGRVQGAESVAVSPDGELVMLDKFGWLHSAREMNGQYVLSERELYIGPGRPLGYHLMDGGRIVLVCDSLKGLLRVDRVDRSIKILANEVAGVPLTYVNDLDVSGKGDVYFTSSTAGVVAIDAKLGLFDTMRSCLFNVLRGDATGALLKYNAATRTTRSLLGGLFFANGVASRGDFVAVGTLWPSSRRPRAACCATGSVGTRQAAATCSSTSSPGCPTASAAPRTATSG